MRKQTLFISFFRVLFLLLAICQLSRQQATEPLEEDGFISKNQTVSSKIERVPWPNTELDFKNRTYIYDKGEGSFAP